MHRRYKRRVFVTNSANLMPFMNVFCFFFHVTGVLFVASIVFAIKIHSQIRFFVYVAFRCFLFSFFFFEARVPQTGLSPFSFVVGYMLIGFGMINEERTTY